MDPRTYSSNGDESRPRSGASFPIRVTNASNVGRYRDAVAERFHLAERIREHRPVASGWNRGFAASERTCVTTCGDAGFMMTKHETETAARGDVLIIVVVMNDHVLETKCRILDRRDHHAEASVRDTPKISDVAEAMGTDT